MSKDINEDRLAERPVIDWLRELGYETLFSPDIAPGGAFMERGDYRDVVLEGRLRRALKRINPNISDSGLDEVAKKIIKYDHADIELGNKEMYEMLTCGIKIDVKDENSETRGKIVYPIDFKNLQNNEFLVVNQYTVQGKAVRIPDLVVFINGIPIAIFELKSPTRENATIADAYGQLHDIYKRDIPKIFYYNQVLVVSDLWHAKHGTVSSSWDFFSVWKGIKSEDEDHKGESELELLTKGVFEKQRLLDIIENFIVFEADAVKDATKFTKKMTMYNQYYGVNKAIDNTLRAISGDRKIGVFWQTQGSGKSLAMVFYVNKVRKLEELNGPTVLFLTDRNDLDQQLYKTFLRTGYPTAKQAESIKGLEDKIKGAGAEVLFTTIQKFDNNGLLSERDNFIVISDEAHRSQYADLAGNVRQVLPKASFMGITGTPIEFSNRNTRLVFGDYISEYPIDKSVEDKVTVPIYYEGRLVPLHVINELIDEDLDQLGLIAEHPQDMTEALKKKWAKLEQVVGSKERIEKIASDIVYHFNNRGVLGKALVVTMSRNIAVEMYKLISKMKNAPETAVVISSNKEYEVSIQKELDNKEIEKRIKNPEDPLKMVIVCDMWLTGFDVPCLQTIYLDKPLKGHSLMQAIARVNRRYKDKEGGLIVDYMGIAENLKKALAIYTSDIQKQALIPIDEIVKKMLEYYGKVKSYFEGFDYKNWKNLSSGAQASIFSKALDLILSKNQKKEYLEVSGRLYKLFALVMPHKAANDIRDKVEFFEGVRRGIIKNTIVDPIYIDKKTESAIRDLISKNIAAEGVIDIFAQYRKEKPDISILDDKFLEEIKNSRFKNLTIEAVHKLFEDELRLREKSNILRYGTLLEKLEKIIEEYENNIINSSKVIERLIELAREIREAGKAGKDLGLTSEEMAFYDALSEGKSALKDGKLKELVKQIVSSVRRDLQIDWISQEVTKARIRTDIRLILLQHEYSFEEVDRVTKKIFEQAFSLYSDYSPGMFEKAQLLEDE
jgi:type I restriction enzyme R subunit